MYYPTVIINKLYSTLYKKEVMISSLSAFLGFVYLQHGVTEWKGASGVRYHMYFSLSDVLLKDAIASPFRDSLTAETTIGALPKTPKLVETHQKNDDDVESEERADAPEMEN